ncbi:MAG: hypothetical protein Fur005_11980 [Roseiflexaceae bacterium]
MSILTLQLLGVAQFQRGNQPIEHVPAKAVALLTYLASMRTPQPRERVLDLLWPESMPAAARKNMRNILWRLGESFGDGLFQQSSSTLSLAASVVVDLHGFEDGLHLLEGGSVARLEQAAAHYRGPLVDGLQINEAPEFEIWLAAERERLAIAHLRLLERIMLHQQTAGQWAALLHTTRRALLHDPLREATHLLQIEALLALGQRSQAQQQYHILSELLQRELAVEPLPETEQRYQQLLAGQRNRVSAPTTPAQRMIQYVRAIPTIIGREQELQLLDQQRDRAASGQLRVVLIAGDLGIGKTHLWRVWAARQPNLTLLETHAIEASDPIPFGPLLHLFRHDRLAQQVLNPTADPAVAPIWLAELSRMMPELSQRWPNLPAPLALNPAEERGRLFQALSEAIRHISGQPVVLMIDDLHWADPSTIDWLAYLTDQQADAAVLLIATYRPQDATSTLQQRIAGWQRQGRLVRIDLNHLTQEEAMQLLMQHGSSANQQSHEWIRQSGGNPYFLLELQRAQANLADQPIPTDLASVVRARLQATVPASAQQVLHAAAVLVEPITISLLHATSGRSEEEILSALDDLSAARVLIDQAEGYQFVHPVVATIVHNELSPARLRFLHRRAAEALERLNPGAAAREHLASQLMQHHAAAGNLEQAAWYAERAANHALTIGATAEAIGYSRRALGWQATPQRQLLLGEAFLSGGSANEAHQLLEAALQGFEADRHVVGITRACMALAMIAIGTNQPLVARAWMQRAPLDRAEQRDPHLGVEALLVAVAIERQSQAFDHATTLLDQAEQIAKQHQLGAIQIQISFERGNLLANYGNLPAAINSFEQSLQYAQLFGNPLYSAMAQNNLAYHTMLLGDLPRAHRHIQAAIQAANNYQLGFLWQYIYSTTGEIAMAEGRAEQAADAFAQAYEVAQTWENHSHMANLRLNQALLATTQQHHLQATELLHEAQQLLSFTNDPFIRRKFAQVSEQIQHARSNA